jgi:DNA-binding response OmpR family regulator
MKRRILLADDDVAVLLTLKTVLEMDGFEVETAGSAAEAVRKLQSGVYQAVITDMRMENEDSGYHVIQAARKQEYNPATAILTAYPPENSEWKRGAQSVLVKPVGTQDLVRKLEALLVQHEDEKQGRKIQTTPAAKNSSSPRESRQKIS